jgi:hypothetical protein
MPRPAGLPKSPLLSGGAEAISLAWGPARSVMSVETCPRDRKPARTGGDDAPIQTIRQPSGPQIRARAEGKKYSATAAA